MTAAIPIVKMSGAGNDFVVLDQAAAALVGDDTIVSWTRRVCRRGLSVGADGVLVVTRSGPERVRVRFLNPDGSEAFCGNGSRCAARFAALRGLARSPMILETASGDVPASLSGDQVRLTLRRPEDLGPALLERGSLRVEGRIVRAGVPHFVVYVEDLAGAPLPEWGPWIRVHPRFGAEGANVDLVQGTGPGSIAIRTWERGVEGETLACGSGALAAALVASIRDGADRIHVLPASGIPLEVELAPRGDASTATLTGDARVVFEGSLPPEGVGGFPAS